ncbi:hypothetical protein [Duganella violaceipulchra]|uniref:Uncharacterized protein n=1 Tax=Duganella violaceipulchra TaxID=2849652 RepID=A0AA41H689_9BURK|nr:hypothetical protein [Duganella violaceicalia]MBV6321134.1 hypothetical protein [Duganella violaceicalia]MCP2009621.1 hypothetical protein [Duganella violaceicalia]
MPNTKLSLITLAGLAVGAGLWLRPGDAPVPAAAVAVAAPAPAPAAQDIRPRSQGAAGLVRSPFGREAPPAQPDAAVRGEARRLRMQAGGYGTPAEYYRMDLKTLVAKAGLGDINAMLQLAEQYESESDALVDDPAFEARSNPHQLGRRYFEEAALAGRDRVVAVIAEKYQADGRPLEAYTWDLLAEKLGVPTPPGLRQQAGAALSAQQRALAEAKLNDLTMRIEKRQGHDK